jgi:hypothetical protein
MTPHEDLSPLASEEDANYLGLAVRPWPGQAFVGEEGEEVEILS